MEQEITEEVLKSMRVGHSFHEEGPLISSMEFQENGEKLVVARTDSSISIYDCLNPKHENKIFCKKYGVEIIKWIGYGNTVLCSSKPPTGNDHSIRFLSLHDNKYIRFFKGHTEKVLSIAPSLRDDFFISSSLDKSVLVWDLRTPSLVGQINAKIDDPFVAFDPAGVVFGVATTLFKNGIYQPQIKLFDLRKIEKGPFGFFDLDIQFPAKSPKYQWTSFQFNHKQTHILLSTNSNYVLLINPLNGQITQIFNSRSNKQFENIEACFTPDSKFILSGSDDGNITFWGVEEKQEIPVMQYNQELIRFTKFNPVYLMFAEGNSTLNFWIPK
ncbi:wd40 repeat protein swd2 [Anaeramoeba ignava]|uniref:Wd40 repeat protein swd2 n=1 Tax=Anaeramoeba ignava TaxID=1746090 RepID=A0A9Q0LJM1_ANAIG|nr:wd40 repeat protein swd2 [Anaeramoeba ignava]